MVSNHKRNVSGMHAAPRCQATTQAGAECRKPAIKGKTRCESHGGKGAGSRDYAQSKDEKRAFRALQWDLGLQVRELEKLIRKLKRSGAPIEVLENLARQRQQLLNLAGQGVTALAAQDRAAEDARSAERDEPGAQDGVRKIGLDHPLRHLNWDRARGAMLGLAVGEAVGVTLFRERRGTFREIEDMRGGGRLGVK